MRMVSAMIEVLCNSINSCLMYFQCYFVPNLQILLVLAEWCLLNLPLAIAYELACQARSNYKLEYLTMYRNNELQKLYYWEDVPSCNDFLLGDLFITVCIVTSIA